MIIWSLKKSSNALNYLMISFISLAVIEHFQGFLIFILKNQ